jgi:predicted RecB family nuclease
MSASSITQRDNGEEATPTSAAEWQHWVAASRTRNYVEKDPLLDWLNLYGVARGYPRDEELNTYDPRTDFVQFMFAKALEFEAAVVAHLKTLASVTSIATSPEDIRSVDKAVQTFEAMRSGAEVICQGVLWNPEDGTYGAPDLLVRSDILVRLVPEILTANEAAMRAPDLGNSRWHYRVVDIKFTTLDIDRTGHETRGHMPYMAQVFIYNKALARMQGYLPPSAFLLGRGWRTSREQGRSCMERLSRVDHDGRIPLATIVADAVEWVRRVRREGTNWAVTPEPSVNELRPNMKNTYNRPWSAAKQQIAHELEELTMLWQVSVDKRQAANDAGISRWTDPRCSAATLGITGPSRAPILDALIQVNQAQDGPAIRRGLGASGGLDWRTPAPVEFYVDFETVNNLNDDFSGIPEISGQELIFMIGCGHMDAGAWSFRCFMVDSLTEQSEATIIDDWFSHMTEVAKRLSAGATDTRVFHWSPAEAVSLETAYRSAQARHPDKDWPHPAWFDFLQNVIRAEPVVIRGAMGFGLKPMAQAMHRHGLIATSWQDGPSDGLGAMVGAWHCQATALSTKVRLPEVPLMLEIAAYNEVDCRVIAEIVDYLRQDI